MDINDLIVSDDALKVIDEGTWVGDFDGAPGLELLVTGLTSKPARDFVQKRQQVLRGKNRGKPLTDEQLATISKDVLVEVVLKDWRGLKSNGQELKYSKDLAKQWINSRNGERFTSYVLDAAQRVDAEAADFVEEVTKK